LGRTSARTLLNNNKVKPKLPMTREHCKMMIMEFQMSMIMELAQTTLKCSSKDKELK
jgi:hypothetical protein